MPTPLPVLAGVYYMHMYATFEGLPTGNIYTWKATTAPTTDAAEVALAQNIAQAMVDEWHGTVGALQSTSVVGWDVKGYALGAPTQPAVTAHNTSSGSNIGDLAAVPTAMVIRHHVARRGRGSQSHTALSPLLRSDIQSDGINLQSGTISAYQSAFEDWVANVQTNVLASSTPQAIDYVQLSKKGSGATYPITSHQVESIVGTERSRTPRR